MSQSCRAIVVIHPGGLGDVLLSLDALLVLRSRFPHHEIVLIAGIEVGQLLAHCGVIDQALPIESRELGTLFSGGEQVSGAMRDVFQRCDLVIGWMRDQAEALQRTIGEFGVPRVILQSPALAVGRHQSERFLQAVQDELFTGVRTPPPLHLPEWMHAAGIATLRGIGAKQTAPLILCHPGSGSMHKCMRPETWSEIFRGCRDRQLTPVVVLGPADEQAAMLVQQAGVYHFPILRPQSVSVLAAILAQAQGYLGHDSGVTHLAARLGVPTVAMFGPTDPQRWAPRGGHVTVVRGRVCSCADWDAVRACIEKPCLNIAVSEVFHALDRTGVRYHRVTNS